jgi:hypothetical protein
MTTKKISSATRALQIYLEHSLATSVDALNQIDESVGCDSDRSSNQCLTAAHAWIDFLQRSQISWSSYILVALDRMEEHLLWAEKAWRNRQRRDYALFSTQSALCFRSASYLVNAHLQSIVGDGELVRLWGLAADTCWTVCLARARCGLVEEAYQTYPPRAVEINTYVAFHLTNTNTPYVYTLQETREIDSCAGKSSDEAVQCMLKQVAQNCRIVRACRRIGEMYRLFAKCFPFSANPTTVELARTCGTAKCAVANYARSARLLEQASTEPEVSVKNLFRRASECALMGNSNSTGAERTSLEVAQRLVDRAGRLQDYASDLSGLFKTLGSYEARAKSGYMHRTHGEARQTQLAAARKELEDAVYTILAVEMFADPTSSPVAEAMSLDKLIAALTRTVRACEEEMSADEKRLRYFTQQADAVKVSASPAHPHIRTCWTKAAEYVRHAMEASAFVDDATGTDREAQAEATRLRNLSDMMVQLAEGVFADAAQHHVHAQKLFKARASPLAIRYCAEAAKELLAAGTETLKSNCRDGSFWSPPSSKCVRRETLARQCALAATLLEDHPDLCATARGLQVTAIKVYRASVPLYYCSSGLWTAVSVDDLCALLNDACYLHGQIHVAGRGITPLPVPRPAGWFIAASQACANAYLETISGTGTPRESPYLPRAVVALNSARKYVFSMPTNVEGGAAPVTGMSAGEYLQHQVCFVRNLQAQRAYQQGNTVECQLWEKAAERWKPLYYWGDSDNPAQRKADPLVRSIGDHLAQRARQLTKREEDLKKMGALALYVSPPHKLGELSPYYSDIRTIARATKDSLVQHALAEEQKKRSPLWTFHTRAAAQYQNVADYTRNHVEVALGTQNAKDNDLLLASLSAQSARCFAYAAEISTTVTDREARDDIVDLYKTAADLLETNLFSKEQVARRSSAVSSEEALRVAEKAGQRSAAAARAKAQGFAAVRNAWMEAAKATNALVMDLEPRRANKRRARVLSEEHSPDALAHADALAARAQALEEDYYTCVDLCDEASAVDSDAGNIQDDGGDNAGWEGSGSTEWNQKGSAPDAESNAHCGWAHGEEENGVSVERVQYAEAEGEGEGDWRAIADAAEHLLASDAVELLMAADAAGAASGTKRRGAEEDGGWEKDEEEDADEQAQKRARGPPDGIAGAVGVDTDGADEIQDHD